MIARRLDRLSPRGRQLASVAAVIGREFEFELLHRTAGLADHDTAEGLEELVRRRVLHATGERFDFTHDRIREVAYLALLPPHRRALHAAIVEAVEQSSSTVSPSTWRWSPTTPSAARSGTSLRYLRQRGSRRRRAWPP